jgi:hypothetical protein
MKPVYKEILFSTLLFISAAFLTTVIHEGGHAFFVKHFSMHTQWYYDHVDYNYQVATKEQAIWICLGGSIFSTIMLLTFFPIALRLKSSNRFVQLFVCWLAFWAIVQVIGYWIIGATPTRNDIAGVYELTGTPWWIRITAAILAIFLFRIFMSKLKNPIVNSMNLKFSADPAKQAKTIILYPSIIATGVLVLLSFPAEAIISIIYPLCTPFFGLSTYFRIAKDKSLQFKDNELKQNQLVVAALLFVTLLVITRIFAHGINL